jgi:lipoprotein-releasing system permease protein
MNITNLLAKRYIFSKSKGGFVTLIAYFASFGIMLGVATLILVTSLMNGIKQEMLSNFIGIDGHLRLQKRGDLISDYKIFADEVKALISPQDLSDISARIDGQLMVTGNNNQARGAQVLAMHSEDLATKPKLASKIDKKLLSQFKAGEGVIIGQRMAEMLDLQAGDMITLISPNGMATAFGNVPRIKAYPVIGTLQLGMHAIDASLILMPYDKAIIYFNMGEPNINPASYIEITLKDMNQAEDLAKNISEKLGAEYLVLPWQVVHQSVFTALQVQRNVMVIILALIVLVAAFNIISSLVMLVKDKQSDVAILRTMGASRKLIMLLFIKTGMMLGLFGTFLGLLLGLLAAENLEAIKAWIEGITGQEILVANIYFLSTLPTQTNWLEVLVIVLISLLISLLATIYPALKAAKIEPAEALRHG